MKNRQVLSLYETLSLPQANPSIDYNDPTNKIITPVDKNRLILKRELLIAVRATLDPEYKIENERYEDNHHYYFYESLYPYIAHGANPHAFRNLPINIGRMPRLFHQWIEKVTIPTEPPSLEVMGKAIRTHVVHKNVVKLETARVRSERSLKRYYDGLDSSDPSVHRAFDAERTSAARVERKRARRYARGLALHKQELELIPEGYQLVDVSLPMPEIAAQLGGYVLKRSMPTRRHLLVA